MTFYRDFELMKHEKYDGFIVTGAPLEQMDYEDVTYWDELQNVFEWAHHNVQSTCYICWAAQAALYHFYGVPKYPTEQKVFGVFRHRALRPELPIFRGFDDEFYLHLQRCVRENADEVGLGRNLDGHEVEDRDAERADILSARPRRVHHEYILLLQQFYRR